jgi:hypothetical protein
MQLGGHGVEEHGGTGGLLGMGGYGQSQGQRGNNAAEEKALNEPGG